MRKLQNQLRLQASIAVIVATAFLPRHATAQESSGAAAPGVEAVTVTGTSIRGIAPVGSELMTVNATDIEETGSVSLQGAFSSVPALTNFGEAPQGENNSSYFSVNIHQLGASASNSTLTLIDGHRAPLGDTNHALVDPNMIAPVAVERVEVLADGASSIYGSDAIAGVVNIITRSDFDGLQLSVQGGQGQGYQSDNGSVLAGHTWGSGNVLFAYSYSELGSLAYGSRPFLTHDHIPEGGTNFDTFNCDPASVQPSGSSGIYPSPTSTTSVANSSANARCDIPGYVDVLPAETRSNILTKVTQTFGKLTLGADLVVSIRDDKTLNSDGSITATVFGAGAQANPYFVDVPGSTATQETVRWDSDALLGPHAVTSSGANTGYLSAHADYDLGENWHVTALALVGMDHSYSYSYGSLCASCAYLALNGTVQSGGSTTAPAIPGTTNVILDLPLTTANALDVWDPASSNKTSAAVIAGLTDSNTTADYYDTISQFRLGIDGTLFNLPGGPVRAALGGEALLWGLNENLTTSQGTGPSSVGGASLHTYKFGRKDDAAYAELDVPVIGSANALPFVQSFDVDISGRYDSYSDVGSRSNPKVSADWGVMDGLKLRASWSTSFVAPAMDIHGNQYGNHGGSGYTDSATQFSVPISGYPNAPLIPGVTCTSVSCTIPATVQGLEVANGNTHIKPETGHGTSLGADFAPEFLQGFDTSITWFNQRFIGGNTAPGLSTIVGSPALQSELTLYPTGATAAQIATETAHVPQSGSVPSPVYYIYQFFQQNVVNIQIGGLDVAAHYQFTTDDFGTFKIGDALTQFLRYDETASGAPPVYSVLNTSGFNQTFPSVATLMRLSFGWTMAGYEADLFVNYTGSYRNWSANTVSPILRNAASAPIGGGDPVAAYASVDAHLAYEFTSGILGDSEVFIDGTNLLSSHPPFFNSTYGYDTYEANPIGRVLSLGLRTKW